MAEEVPRPKKKRTGLIVGLIFLGLATFGLVGAATAKQPVVTSELSDVTTSIPFESDTAYDSTMDLGTSQVTQAGVNGTKVTTYNVTKTDGQETSRTEVSEKVTIPAVKQVTTYGTYVAPVAPSSSGATAKCSDGTLSYSAHRSGTCSHHGGVAIWY